MRLFRLAPEAGEDIKGIWSFIVRDSVEAAAKVREDIRDNCRRLARHPYMGHRRDDLTTRKDVLFWPVYSYHHHLPASHQAARNPSNSAWQAQHKEYPWLISKVALAIVLSSAWFFAPLPEVGRQDPRRT